MPSLVRYQNTPETQADLPWADLITLDLGLFDKPQGKQKLARDLQHAIHTVGFFYVTNFGLSEQDVEEQFGIAEGIFNEPLDEKMKCRVNTNLPGGPLGYKPKGFYDAGKSGLKDALELYDDPKYNAHFEGRVRPKTCEENAAINAGFCKHLHNHVLYKLLVLTAIILELDDEDTLWRMHNYDSMSNCHMRYMLQHPRSPEEVEILENSGSAGVVTGHTDFGSFTLLFRQPVAALQIRRDGADEDDWLWVRPAKHAITVNVADTISFLTGGYLKSTMHRVSLPPPDQRHIPRLSVIYFTRPDDETELKPVDSPLSKRVGNTAVPPPASASTAGEWIQARYNNISRMVSEKKVSKSGSG